MGIQKFIRGILMYRKSARKQMVEQFERIRDNPKVTAFSRVSQMLSKDRNRLDIVKRGDLRLSLTSIEPNINKLAEKNRPLGSH
ncbi:hypothetical protein QYM36_011218 [Artemia franciscana]|uniref:Uncharacterized protein n=1 Tax=Artemia franciscana TaxID=6661 RepID=A0AA88L104_ARTSF|nr:hypothetical protein QYM36_011218 [Artemia franciscana]